MEFLHVSKAGGTSTCQVAGDNGCTSHGFDDGINCRIPGFPDGPRWIAGPLSPELSAEDARAAGVAKGVSVVQSPLRVGRRVSCASRAASLSARALSFYANEYAVHSVGESSGAHAGECASAALNATKGACPPHVCAEFSNLLVLREPGARLASHVKFIMTQYALKFGEAAAKWFEGRDLDYWRSFAPAIVDNYYTRLLNGEGVYVLPVGGITEGHARAAMAVLAQYDVIVVLGVAGAGGPRDTSGSTSGSGGAGATGGTRSTSASSVEDASAWAAAAGWNVTLHGRHARDSMHYARSTNVSEWMPRVAAGGRQLGVALAPGNDHDAQVYAWGVALAALDSLVWGVADAMGAEAVPQAGRLDGARAREGPCGFVGRAFGEQRRTADA